MGSHYLREHRQREHRAQQRPRHGWLRYGRPVPWHGSVPFDGSAHYYDVSAQLQGSGDITCKIVVSGPGLNPLTVSSGHASGGFSICSAQAAPTGPTGISWQNEE